jgi:hypothetical protein
MKVTASQTFARRPIALAKLRICRGLTTETGIFSPASSLTIWVSRPPVLLQQSVQASSVSSGLRAE